ncbi:hypothetical protein BLOT_005673 [Blomia tropicalis]|nr:hypothetical protein BLOT_005673 [Blomia tropicalis]
MDTESFSNPLAPPSHAGKFEETNANSAAALTNADFRKILMTPRVLGSGSSALQTPIPGSVRGSVRKSHHSKPSKINNESSENSKKKKKFYETLRKQDDDVLNELSKRYRDRAKERRELPGPGMSDLGDMSVRSTANTAYHAVAPGNFDLDATERRKQMIQESKYLGGDMEHTHLVKGLDYALLQKVKAEIQNNDEEERYLRLKQEEEARKEEEQKKKSQAGLTKLSGITFDDTDRYAVKSKIAENILKSAFNTDLPERNELFIQGRMAYQYDLVDEFPESDIPTTIIRSKAECPNLDAYNSISTNDIIINKLIQIWQSIRQGGTTKKVKKLRPDHHWIENEDIPLSKSLVKGDSIYDDIGDYIPSIPSKRKSQHSNEPEKKRFSYFDKPKSSQTMETDSNRRISQQKVLELAASVVGKLASTTDTLKLGKSRRSAAQPEPDSYAECYPGAPENDDAILDSDDEVDFSKMDTGTKKGTVNRWDFDTAEEYGDYMSNREAMPKAAFQYGVKMGDGRKSKKTPSKKEEKAKLDRDLQKINALIAKRKKDGQDVGLSYVKE